MSKSKFVNFTILALFFSFTAYSIYILPMLLEHGGGKCLVDERKNGYHTDYVWGYVKGIKWKDTVFCDIEPPLQVAGNQKYFFYLNPKPIPPPRQWQLSKSVVKTSYWDVSLWYFAFTTGSRFHGRIGWRWDDIDNFFLFSVVPAKRIPLDWELCLWLRAQG